MAASKFTDETRNALLDHLADGVSLGDACREAGVNHKTVKHWLTRGRKEDDGDYAEFAAAVDATRQDAAGLEEPGTQEELVLVVWRAAKKGSVAAQKLYWEMLRAPPAEDDESDSDPFSSLDAEDELAAKREKAKAVHG